MKKISVVLTTDQDLARTGLLLEVTAKTQTGIARREQLGIHRPVRVMAYAAPFAHRFVLEHIRASLRIVATQTLLVKGQGGQPAAARDGLALVGRMTIGARQAPLSHSVRLRDGMTRGKAKPSANIQMAVVANRWITFRIDDIVTPAAIFAMKTPRPVAHLATRPERIVPSRQQSSMARAVEIHRDLLVANRTVFVPDELRAGNARGSHHRPIQRTASDESGYHNARCQASGQPAPRGLKLAPR